MIMVEKKQYKKLYDSIELYEGLQSVRNADGTMHGAFSSLSEEEMKKLHELNAKLMEYEPIMKEEVTRLI